MPGYPGRHGAEPPDARLGHAGHARRSGRCQAGPQDDGHAGESDAPEGEFPADGRRLARPRSDFKVRRRSSTCGVCFWRKGDTDHVDQDVGAGQKIRQGHQRQSADQGRLGHAVKRGGAGAGGAESESRSLADGVKFEASKEDATQQGNGGAVAGGPPEDDSPF